MASIVSEIMSSSSTPDRNGRIYSHEAMTNAIKDYNQKNSNGGKVMGNSNYFGHQPQDRVHILEGQIKRLTEKLDLMEEFMVYKGITEEGDFQDFVEWKQTIEEL